jgi:hypothetical protein
VQSWRSIFVPVLGCNTGEHSRGAILGRQFLCAILECNVGNQLLGLLARLEMKAGPANLSRHSFMIDIKTFPPRLTYGVMGLCKRACFKTIKKIGNSGEPSGKRYQAQ